MRIMPGSHISVLGAEARVVSIIIGPVLSQALWQFIAGGESSVKRLEEGLGAEMYWAVLHPGGRKAAAIGVGDSENQPRI